MIWSAKRSCSHSATRTRPSIWNPRCLAIARLFPFPGTSRSSPRFNRYSLNSMVIKGTTRICHNAITLKRLTHSISHGCRSVDPIYRVEPNHSDQQPSMPNSKLCPVIECIFHPAATRFDILDRSGCPFWQVVTRYIQQCLKVSRMSHF